MKTAIVTGATGFIGANLARRLIRQNYSVHLLLRPQHQTWRIHDIKKDLACHTVDFLDKTQLLKIFQKIKPDHIFNLAAYGAYSYQQDFKPMVETNTLSVSNLIDAGLKTGFDSFIQVGTSSEYGFKNHAPKENESIQPNSTYALTKSWATMLSQNIAYTQKANIVIIRPYTIFGPYEEPTRFIPTLILKGLNGKLPPLVDGRIARDYVYVDDFVEACILAAKKASKHRGEIYNVGSGIQTTIKEAVVLAQSIFLIKENPHWGSMPNRRWDTSVWIAAAQKIKKDLGWSPKNTFEEGFRKTLQWFEENPKIKIYYQKRIK